MGNICSKGENDPAKNTPGSPIQKRPSFADDVKEESKPADMPSEVDVNVPKSKKVGDLIPGYNDLSIPDPIGEQENIPVKEQKEVICAGIPGYNGLNIPEAGGGEKTEKAGAGMEADGDENLCPLIPGYYGLRIPDAEDKKSKIERDEVEECKQEIISAGRSLHWVIRNSNLQPALQFFDKVLGLCVLRHEENAEPCDITCNGSCRTAWSKTMMGYHGREEDFAYALEVTYNYGVEGYEKGSGLQRMGMFVSDVDAALGAAKELGFEAGSNNIIVGPDAYSYQVLSMPDGRQEPFAYVSLNVTDLKRSVEFYTNTIGMKMQLPGDLSFEVPENSTVVGFAPTARCEGVPLVLTQSDTVKIQDYDGRHAIEMPEMSIRRIYADLEKNSPDLIVHELRELHEQLGTLVITIIKDYDGFEICLVSSETFSLLVKSGTDYKLPDFKAREEKLASS